MKRLSKLIAQSVAAAAIALFWCISAVGTTVGTTVGITTLATAVTAATSSPAEAGRGRGRGHWRGRGRGHWRGRGLAGMATPTIIGPIGVRASAYGSAFSTIVVSCA